MAKSNGGHGAAWRRGVEAFVGDSAVEAFEGELPAGERRRALIRFRPRPDKTQVAPRLYLDGLAATNPE